MRKRFQNHNTIKSFIRHNRVNSNRVNSGRSYWLRKGVIFAPISSFLNKNRTVSDFIWLTPHIKKIKKRKPIPSRTTRKHKIEVKLIRRKFKND